MSSVLGPGSDRGDPYYEIRRLLRKGCPRLAAKHQDATPPSAPRAAMAIPGASRSCRDAIADQTTSTLPQLNDATAALARIQRPQLIARPPGPSSSVSGLCPHARDGPKTMRRAWLSFSSTSQKSGDSTGAKSGGNSSDVEADSRRGMARTTDVERRLSSKYRFRQTQCAG
jgi:hypothetical protein